MNERYLRKSNEEEYEYGLRLISIKVEEKPNDLDWQDIVELTGMSCHRDTLRKAATGCAYSSYEVMQYFKHKQAIEAKRGDDAYQKELDDKLLDIQKQTKQLQDQRRELTKVIDTIGRSEHLEDMMIDAARALDKSIGRIEFEPVYGNIGENEAILVYCDWHYGMTTDNIWNKYDTDICKRRVKYVTQQAAEKLLFHKCEKLHVVVLGDLIHGAIHVSTRVVAEELTCEQLMNSSEILAQSIEYLSQYVPYINVYTTYGNHARAVENKSESIHRDNFERIIPWWLKERLKDYENICIVPDLGNEYIYFDACGYGVCAAHGDLDNVKNAPRLASSLFYKRYGKDIDYVLLADKHHRESFEELGVTAMICGALCGSDDYANDKRLYSLPEQVLFIMNPDVGMDAEYHIKCNL